MAEKYYKHNRTRYIGKFGVLLKAGNVDELDTSVKAEKELIDYIEKHFTESFVNVFQGKDRSGKKIVKRVPISEKLTMKEAEKFIQVKKSQEAKEEKKLREDLKD